MKCWKALLRPGGGDDVILISSHELTEARRASVAPDRVLMDQGQFTVSLRISKAARLARFRGVGVTLAGEEHAAPKASAAALAGRRCGRALCAVSSKPPFSTSATYPTKPPRCAGAIQRLEARAVSLREISKALMRASRAGFSTRRRGTRVAEGCAAQGFLRLWSRCRALRASFSFATSLFRFSRRRRQPPGA